MRGCGHGESARLAAEGTDTHLLGGRADRVSCAQLRAAEAVQSGDGWIAAGPRQAGPTDRVSINVCVLPTGTLESASHLQ